MPDEAPLQGPEILNGWKEIAAYLGRTPRSVQRWEREFRLPVHRLATPDGGRIIYARRSELDAWRAGLEQPPEQWQPEDDVAEVRNPAEPADDTRFTALVGPSRRTLTFTPGQLVLVLSVVALVSAAVTLLVDRRVVSHAVDVVFAHRELHGLDSNGRVVWRHRFDTRVFPPYLSYRVSVRPDLDGDEIPDFLVPVRFGGSNRLDITESDAVVALTARGRLAWQVKPDMVVSVGPRQVSGPWLFSAVAAAPDDPEQRTWVSFHHHTWSPAFVFEVLPDGGTLIRYAQDGWIRSLAVWHPNGRPLLAAAGVSNAHLRASLALVDLDAPAAQFATPDSAWLRCDGCPTGASHAVYLFPPSEIAKGWKRPYTSAGIGGVFDGALELTIEEGLIAFLEPDQATLRWELADTFWTYHRELEASGQIQHSAEDCPERLAIGEVRRWQPANGWTLLAATPRERLLDPASR